MQMIRKIRASSEKGINLKTCLRIFVAIVLGNMSILP